MTLILESAFVTAVAVDSYEFSEGGTQDQANAIAASGVDAMYGYLGVIDTTRMNYILNAVNPCTGKKMAFMPVGLAGRFDGPTMVAQMDALGIPHCPVPKQGCSLPFDLEGMTDYNMDPVKLAGLINTAASAVNVNHKAELYVGSPQPLTSKELYSLNVYGYWRGAGAIKDRYGYLAEPNCGWFAEQKWPSVQCGGVLVDKEMIGQDYFKRLPVWVRSI